MEDVLKEYPNDIRLVYKNLPLPFHQQAKPAAIAALAANEQGKFWEMHDELFANQSRIQEGETFLFELAEKIGLEMDKFKKDFANDKFARMVDEDAALANKLGITGTPGFFVNGVKVTGARPLPYFKMIIDRWMQEKS
jgi:protein-disulfide isomerase